MGVSDDVDDGLRGRTRPQAVAALVHGYSWVGRNIDFQLSRGVSVVPLEDSRIEALYKKLCRRRDVDDGDPLGYQVAVVVQPSLARAPHAYLSGAPGGLVERALNALVVTLGVSPGVVRLIYSTDAFKSSDHTEILMDSPLAATALHVYESERPSDIDDSILEIVDRIWRISSSFWDRRGDRSRLFNALTYFFLAWRAPYPEQACINLAIVLETLFAPHTATETTHQIAYNASRFYANSASERESIYDMVRAFYGVRSAIVHGGSPAGDKVQGASEEMFALVADILRRVFETEERADAFEDDQRRRALLRKYVFE